MFLTPTVETESAYFTFHMTLLRFVSVVFRPCGGEFYNIIPLFQFVGEFPQVVSKREFGESGFPGIDDAVRVEVEHLFRLELFDALV